MFYRAKVEAVKSDDSAEVLISYSHSFYRFPVFGLCPTFHLPHSLLKLPHITTVSLQVLYIDYGNRETLSLSEIYPLASQFTLLPGLALHCSLFEISPKEPDDDDVEWSKDCIDALHSITDDKRFFLIMKECCIEGGNMLNQVDLRGEEIPSVRDFLVFLDYATLAKPPSASLPSTPFKPISPQVTT